MRRIQFTSTACAALLMTLAACGRNAPPALDDALRNDLALASQAQAFNPQTLVSPAEAAYAQQQQYAPRTLSPVARQPVAQVRRAPVRRTSTASSSGASYPAPEPPTHIEKNTGRDAAIGAVAGAVIGATTSRNKVQGGLIGAAIGGVLGGVIGNNVDVKKKTGW